MSEDKNILDYPMYVNPNYLSSGALGIERAKLAMTLADDNSPEAQKLRDALLDDTDELFEDDK